MFTSEAEPLIIQGYCLQVSGSREQQLLAMHLKYAEMLDIVVHENMKLEDNTPQ